MTRTAVAWFGDALSWGAARCAWILVASLWAVVLLTACGGEPAPSQPSEPSQSSRVDAQERTPIALPVLFAGCKGVRPGPVCRYQPADSLHVWVDVDPRIEVWVGVDGTEVLGNSTPVDGGQRWIIPLGEGARTVELRAELVGGSGRYTIALEPVAELPGRLASIVSRAQHPESSAQAWQELRDLIPTLEGDELATALQLHADHEFESNRPAEAVAAYERAIEAAVAVGRTSDASVMAQRAAYVCLALRYDGECGRRWVERDEQLVVGDPERRMAHRYYAGLLAQSVGDWRGALVAYQEHEHEARKLGLPKREAAALSQQAVLVGRLGASARARELVARARSLESQLPRRARGQLLNGIAWMMLEARARDQPTEDPRPILRDALALAAEDDPTRGVIVLNLAYAAVLNRDALEARRWLDASEAIRLGRVDQRWRELLRARLALAEGDAAAAKRNLAGLRRRLGTTAEFGLRLQVAVGYGEALEALGDDEAALESYRGAERLLDEQLPRIALGAGRGRFAAERGRSTRRIVDLLLRRGEVESALCAARLSRTRVLRILAEQLRRRDETSSEHAAIQEYRERRAALEAALDRSYERSTMAGEAERRDLAEQHRDNEAALDRLMLKLSGGASASARCDDLVGPAPRHIDLHYVELDDGWVVFAVSRSETVVHRLGPRLIDSDVNAAGSRRALGEALVMPLADLLAKADHVRVMLSGDLVRVPFHALPLADERLLVDAATVAYGLDLPRQGPLAAPTWPIEPGRAVVVVPPSNLIHSVAELAGVQSSLTRGAWTVKVLEGAQADGPQVRAELSRAALLHYLGHGRSDGIGGWDSTLSLAREGTLSISDLLVLPRAPRLVVLNGCETGLADPQALAGGMSLAHGFVLRGADAVVATTTTVDDKAAAALMLSFHEALRRSGDPREALQVAQRSRRDHDEAWLHTRVWVP